jgi:16S rRNA (cytidine1402-2'-O)-methyltransferase
LDTLKRVAVIYCEDTRVTRKLLDRYEITIPVKSYHQHSGIRVIREIRVELEKGDVALVTDAGTPGVADPGNELVSQLLVVSSQLTGLKIVPIPGPSAVTAAAGVCGFDMSRFTFLGYVPKKKGRNKFFKQVAESTIPVILYEAPYRIVKTLEELRKCIEHNSPHPSLSLREGDESNPPLKVRGGAGGVMKHEERRVVVCRELTKQFESIYRGTIEEVLEQVQSSPIKGEYVIVIEGA